MRQQLWTAFGREVQTLFCEVVDDGHTHTPWPREQSNYFCTTLPLPLAIMLLLEP
jgi:hypothetical protein